MLRVYQTARALAPRVGVPLYASLSSSLHTSRSCLSDNITYSGGQPGNQGGFYGAGGARATGDHKAHHRPEAVAALDDIRKLREIIADVSEKESELKKLGSAVSSSSIELKSVIKKKLSSPTTVELLKRLEINNQPVWGLTQEERELVRIARQKINSC